MRESAKDATHYPLLRNLQFSPIKENDEQYVLLWDPTGLTAEKLIVPLSYFYLLQFFDGEHSLEQLGAEYLKKFGEFFVPERLQKLVADLDEKLFLEGERVASAKEKVAAEYRQAPVRRAVYAGKSYEEDKEKLRLQLEGFFTSREGPGSRSSANKGKKIKGIVAPHYEMRMGGPIYAWAYKELKEAEAPDLFVIVGTRHAGLKNLFAVTDKDFETPLGRVLVDGAVLERFREHGGAPFFEEEVSHRSEHTIEFQLPFLQHAMGGTKPITIVPVLCAFPPACLNGPQLREVGAKVASFLGAMRRALADSGKDFCVVASADLAHIGLRYGDAKAPTDYSFHRCMQTDMEMLKHVENLDAVAFARFIEKEEDARRICGFSPIYTLLKLIQAEKGEVLRYDRGITDQFNSTVTFASMAFY